MSFKKIYKEVVELQKLDAEITGASALHHLAKTAEEFGELAQEVNKTTGSKQNHRQKEVKTRRYSRQN